MIVVKTYMLAITDTYVYTQTKIPCYRVYFNQTDHDHIYR